MKKKRVAIVKCKSYSNKEVKGALVESFKLLDFEFKKGMKVLIKPNVLGAHKPDDAITTHPAMVEELCKLLKGNGAKIYIGDSSSANTLKAFEVSGIGKIARKYGKLVNFETEKKFMIRADGGAGEVFLPKILNDVDLVINFPKLKTHGFTKMTGAVKNLFGLVSGRTKAGYHRILKTPREFSNLLVQIHQHAKPQLNIMDGVIGIEGMGPGPSGTKKHTGLLLASKNAFALDFAASELIGYKAKDIWTNRLAIEKGIFNGEVEKVGNGKDIFVKYKKPFGIESGITIFSFIDNLIPRGKIEFDYEKCTKCAKCATICPVSTIKMSPYPECNHKNCIECFCCIEVCPEAAVYFKESKIRILTKKAYRMIMRR